MLYVIVVYTRITIIIIVLIIVIISIMISVSSIVSIIIIICFASIIIRSTRCPEECEGEDRRGPEEQPRLVARMANHAGIYSICYDYIALHYIIRVMI